MAGRYMGTGWWRDLLHSLSIRIREQTLYTVCGTRQVGSLRQTLGPRLPPLSVSCLRRASVSRTYGSSGRGRGSGLMESQPRRTPGEEGRARNRKLKKQPGHPPRSQLDWIR